MEKEKRIKKEENRLKKIYKNIGDKKKETVIGLIQRLAYQRVSLEDFEKDLDEYGFTEPFQQGEKQEPYERKRPIADLYNSMITSYQKGIKQLTDLLPKEDARKNNYNDEFEDFVKGREDI